MDQATIDRLRGIPALCDLDDGCIQGLAGHCLTRDLAPGETVFREGEYGFEVYAILSGAVRILKTSAATGDRTLATLGPGEIFGEMGPMVGQPRSATVVAAETTTLVEVDQQGFEDLLDVPSFKDYVDRAYMERALAGHLKDIPLFREVPEESRARLVERVRLVTFGKGDVIVSEGAEGDAFYLIRRGFVKVSRRRGERTDAREVLLGYLRDNGWFGEMALIEETRRTATITALGPVEVIRIDRADFLAILSESPDVRATLDRHIAQIRASEALEDLDDAARDEKYAVLVEKGLVQVKEVLTINLDTCTRCRNCETNCAVTHGDSSRIVRKGFRVGGVLFPASCYMCPDPECMKGCRFGVIYREPDGSVAFRDNCTGCGWCARACPYGVITMAWEPVLGARPRPATPPPRQKIVPRLRRVAVKCDMCKGLGFTACTANCPTDAIRRVDPRWLLTRL